MRVQRRRRPATTSRSVSSSVGLPGNSDAVWPSGPRPRCTRSIGGAARTSASYAARGFLDRRPAGTSSGSRAGCTRVEQHPPGHALVRVGIVGARRSARRRSTRRRSTSRAPARAPPRSTPRRSRRPTARPTAGASRARAGRTRAGRRRRSGPCREGVMLCHSSRSWTASTVDVYEAAGRRSGSTQKVRPDPGVARAVRGAGARRRASASTSACGPGWHTAGLGAPAIAATRRRRCSTSFREHAPGARRVVADLEALPFRRGALGGTWAHKCYMHIAGRRACRSRSPTCTARCRSAARCTCTSPPTGSADGLRRPVRGPALRRLAARAPRRRRGRRRASRSTRTLDDGEEWIDVEATRARTLADTVGPGHAPARRRPEPERVLGRRRARLRPARQPLLARRARSRHRHARPRSGARAAGRRRRHDRPREARDAARRRAHARRVPHGRGARRTARRVARAARGVLRRPRAATASRSTARRSPAGSPSRSAAARPT